MNCDDRLFYGRQRHLTMVGGASLRPQQTLAQPALQPSTQHLGRGQHLGVGKALRCVLDGAALGQGLHEAVLRGVQAHEMGL